MSNYPNSHYAVCNYFTTPVEDCKFCKRLFLEEQTMKLSSSPLISSATYNISLKELKNVIANSIGVDPEKCDLEFKIGTDYGPTDRGPGVSTLTGIRLVVK